MEIMIPRIRRIARKMLGVDDEFFCLRRALTELDNVEELRKLFGWKLDPVLDDPSIYEFDSIEDINLRRVRDAECIGTIMRNSNPSICLEIGTAEGHTAALMAVNAPQARVFTVNIPPEEILAGDGGVLTTIALERERIGSYYRQRNLTNVEQILANTARWEPDLGKIDVALVDGCHDTDFVYNDSRKVLKQMRPGSLLLWHDFNFDLIDKKGWIREVCLGVEKLIGMGFVKGQIFHVRNSWLGIYQVPNSED
jgi:predicted O-methyltransferase YrrM